MSNLHFKLHLLALGYLLSTDLSHKENRRSLNAKKSKLVYYTTLTHFCYLYKCLSHTSLDLGIMLVVMVFSTISTLSQVSMFALSVLNDTTFK